MIPRECKCLAEVDFPIALLSKHAALEKSIRHGHPSTLHLWWARRPLASSRAVLLALLLPDPCDPYCPNAFAGKPLIRDMRLSVRFVLSSMAQGVTAEGTLHEYSDLESDDVRASVVDAHAVIARDTLSAVSWRNHEVPRSTRRGAPTAGRLDVSPPGPEVNRWTRYD